MQLTKCSNFFHEKIENRRMIAWILRFFPERLTREERIIRNTTLHRPMANVLKIQFAMLQVVARYIHWPRDTWHVMLRLGPSFTVAVPSLVPSWIVVTSLLILNVQIFCYFRRHFPIAQESRTACAKCSSPQKQNRHCWMLLPHLDQASSWSCLSSAQPSLLQCIVTIVCKAFWRINKN